jgi:hypothetical protein
LQIWRNPENLKSPLEPKKPAPYSAKPKAGRWRASHRKAKKPQKKPLLEKLRNPRRNLCEFWASDVVVYNMSSVIDQISTTSVIHTDREESVYGRDHQKQY